MVNQETYQRLCQKSNHLQLQESKLVLHAYTAEMVYPKGVAEYVVNYKNQNYRLPLLVLSGNGPNLVDRDWLEKVRLDWQNVRRLVRPRLDEVLNKYVHSFK